MGQDKSPLFFIMSLNQAKIALVFDWMTNPGGAEKVNMALHKIFPEAPIFTSIYNPEKLPGFEKAQVHTSFIQSLPWAKKHHQLYLGLMPYAYELFDLSEFDIVISSSHACAKGVITKPETLHLCYCHTPMRYAWDDWQAYIDSYKMNPIFKALGKKRIHKIRIWDRLAADRVDHFIANSTTTKQRIAKYYRRDSTVIHPMVNLKQFQTPEETPKAKGGYFLAVGRLTPYKQFDLIVETFNKLQLPLKIVGTGVAEKSLKEKANANIEFLGYVADGDLQKLYAECEALIFPQKEDFGIIPLEAMACGRPVIAFKEGGALDTIIDEKTGVFFNKQTEASLKKAIEKYQAMRSKFKPEKIREHVEKFDEKHFKEKLLDFIKLKWEERS